MFETLSPTMEILGWIATIVSLIGIPWIRYSTWREQKRQNQRIQIKLISPTKEQDLPGDLRRANLSRAEIQGYLGAIPKKVKGGRYDIDYLISNEFFNSLREAQLATGESTIGIKCKQDEFDQFDIEAVDKINKKD